MESRSLRWDTYLQLIEKHFKSKNKFSEDGTSHNNVAGEVRCPH